MKKEQTIAEFPIPDTRECECRLLNTMMLTPECVFQVTNVIKREMFSEENKQVWDAITDAFANHETINPVTISTRVNRRNFSENIITAQPVYGNIELQDLMASFVDTYIKRRAYILAIDTLSKVNANIPPSEITSAFDDFSKKVYSGLADDENSTSVEVSEKIEIGLKSGKATRVPTSIKQLDFLTHGGFNAGNLVILAARPSAGKTSAALQIAQSAAKAGIRSLFLSLEMTSEELVQRLLLATERLTPEQLYSKNIDWKEFENAKALSCNENMLINDKVGGIDDICNRIRLSVQVEGIKFVVIDYLGLIPFDKRLNTATAIGELTRKLKCTAKECEIPILLLCQLNRSSVSENRSPQMHDLRDSGAIEQDADIVLMLERAKDDSGTIIDNTIDMWVRKNRSGRCTFDSPIRLYGNKVYSNFKEEPYEAEEMPF